MSLMRWHRGRRIPTVWDQMEQLARDMTRLMPWTEGSAESALAMPVDVYETDDEVVVKAQVPGMKREDLEINIQDGNLTIRGTTKIESETKEENYYHKEIRTGNFFRAVALPSEVKEEELKAKYEDGVVTVRAPKAKEEKIGRKIEVE